MGTIDLHTHTTFSDGTFTPRELISHARSIGLDAIAITDHDTLAGIPEGIEAGKASEMEVIPGVELSIEYPLPDNGHLHMLGLFLDPHSPHLADGLRWLRDQRDARTPKIIERLAELDIHITEHEIHLRSGEGSVGRPHIARILIEKGHAGSIREAFDRYLAKGAPAYVPKSKFSLDRAITMIHKAGGIPVLAHPFSLHLEERDLRSLLVSMMRMGLGGIEALYTEHSREQTSMFLELAGELDLGVSGGSDFHGTNKPDIELGTGRGDLSIPSLLLDDLRSRLG